MARRRIAWAMDESGKGKRTLQEMAKSGAIPGAAKIGGEWTFDVVEFKRWILEQVEACRTTPISTRSGARGTSARKSVASASDEAYERVLS